MDWNDFELERERFISDYKNISLVAYVPQPNQEMMLFGPFVDGEEAMDWMVTVPSGVQVTFVPLRRAFRNRVKNDFFVPRHMIPKDEYTTV